MHIKDLYSVIVTEKRAECRDFYVRWFGFQVVFEASWFVYLAATGDHAFGIAFMAPDHPSRPPGPETFDGRGVFLTVQVADATAEFARLKGAGLSIAYPLQDEPWGQRRFAVFDPSGTWIDVVEQIEPAPGFWDPYVA
ncbi:MAG TPA: VOC family protein [Thermoanaerobaculia bacterium]|nr:VOC family protein [Thermoanaerobaculia bacterium]